MGRLAKRHSTEPNFLEVARKDQGRKELVGEAIQHLVGQLHQNDVPIENAKQVQKHVKQGYGVDASEKLIRQTMKRDMRMSFRLAKRVPKQGNTERCLVLRQ